MHTIFVHEVEFFTIKRGKKKRGQKEKGVASKYSNSDTIESGRDQSIE